MSRTSVHRPGVAHGGHDRATHGSRRIERPEPPTPKRGARRTLLATLAVLALATLPAHAQDKPTLTPEDYGQWESLGMTELSPNGAWIAYGIRRVDGETELRLRGIDHDTTSTIDHGAAPAFSSDSRWVAYSVVVPRDERERLRKAKKPVHNDVELRNLETGEVTTFPGVSRFAFSDDGAFLAMRGYPARGAGHKGVDLVVRDLATGIDTHFGNVSNHDWQTDGRLLAMTIDTESKNGNGVRIYDPTTGTLRTLISDTTSFTNLAWRDSANDLAVLRTAKEPDDDEKTHHVLAWTGLDRDRPTHHAFTPETSDEFPTDSRIVGTRSLRWAEHGGAIFFGIQERDDEDDDAQTVAATDEPAEDEDEDEDEPKDKAEESDEEPANVEVWHAADVDIIPEQKIRAGRERNRNHLAVWHFQDDRYVQLGSDRFRSITLVEGHRHAIGTDGTPYEADRMFGPVYQDPYLIDVETGEREQIGERIQFSYGTSPGGRYFLYLEDDDYWTVDLRDGTRTNITRGLAPSFVNLDNDHTIEQKPPYGVAGWTEDDHSVILNTKYDLWEVQPDGSGGESLTNGADDEVRHRYARVDPDARTIDLSKPVYLHLYGEWTKKSGYGRLQPNGTVERLVWLDKNVSRLTRAEDADVYAYTIEAFDESPNYYIGGPELANARRVTDTNPFQDEFAWGHSELVDFENEHGQRLQGALHYPANYEPGKQYPMLVYIYEIVSDGVHRYTVPSERHPYNPTVYTQEGYFVFQPDIVYRPRNPGLSAVESLVPAVETVLETGMVDPDRVGLVGHSWGGYQTAFAVTQTDIFSAAVAGAPLTNMISMYLSIYWNSGGTDARIFEISQGRMEVPFWKDTPSYIANSPVFHIEQMNTPLLMTFGDEDGAVEFNQGVEMYNAARRANKDMVLLVYPGENHSLAEKPNQLDYHRRILEWFGHYLKDEDAQQWITEGVPHLEREEELKEVQTRARARARANAPSPES